MEKKSKNNIKSFILLGLLLANLSIYISGFLQRYKNLETEQTSILFPSHTYFAKCIVKVRAFADDIPLSMGTGFLIESGKVITAGHVVRGSNRVELTYQDNTLEVSTNFNTSPNHDITIIQVNKGGKTFTLKPNPLVGDKVFVVGYTFSLAKMRLTEGVISSEEMDFQTNWKKIFLIDVHSSPGNSGSPVMTHDGKIVGMVVGGMENAFIAIPARILKEEIYGPTKEE